MAAALRGALWGCLLLCGEYGGRGSASAGRWAAAFPGPGRCSGARPAWEPGCA